MHTMLKLSIITKDHNMKRIPPERILKREIDARGLSANRLALSLRVPSGLKRLDPALSRNTRNCKRSWK